MFDCDFFYVDFKGTSETPALRALVFPSAKCGGLENTKQNKTGDAPTVHLTGYKKQRCSISELTYDQMNFSAIDYFLS